jgi:hypothetical protein
MVRRSDTKGLKGSTMYLQGIEVIDKMQVVSLDLMYDFLIPDLLHQSSNFPLPVDVWSVFEIESGEEHLTPDLLCLVHRNQSLFVLSAVMHVGTLRLSCSQLLCW